MSPRQGAEPAKLLVVDDEDSVLKLVCTLLQRDGYSVLAAHDGSDALSLARTRGHEIDILLTDLRMPGLGGAELARAVVRLHPHIRVIYMTGFAEEQFGPGTQALRKPFKPGALRDVVERASANPEKPPQGS